MPTPFRLDQDVVAKGVGSMVAALFLGGGKLLWEWGKKRGRKGLPERVPAYLRVEQLEAELAKKAAAFDLASAENFDMRNRWSEREIIHRDRQGRMMQRVKAAEGKARMLGADLADARGEIDALKDHIERLTHEPPRPDQAAP